MPPRKTANIDLIDWGPGLTAEKLYQNISLSTLTQKNFVLKSGFE